MRAVCEGQHGAVAVHMRRDIMHLRACVHVPATWLGTRAQLRVFCVVQGPADSIHLPVPKKNGLHENSVSNACMQYVQVLCAAKPWVRHQSTSARFFAFDCCFDATGALLQRGGVRERGRARSDIGGVTGEGCHTSCCNTA